METSLHRDLKHLYADGEAVEARLGRYRIDAIVDGELIEIQHSGLGAIRDKVRALTAEHRVLVVKPIVRQKHLVKRAEPEGPVCERRLSPKRGTPLDGFSDLVHFVSVFPHPNLTLEFVLVDVEEWRIPGHGRRRRYGRADHVVQDRRLLDVFEVFRLRTARDLLRLAGPEARAALPEAFTTADLARLFGMKRRLAQRMAYCLRVTGAVRAIGHRERAILYAAA